ncbi:MAG: GNAT family N-acetyltransferase [Oscillospiraceae bacterium]|nr:GNAT family N-acetyltransferase [Oscillospiraceae bacterium]
MELIVKHFSQLTRDELFAIYKLRVAVFIVEQQCAYPEVDEHDPAAYHLWLQDGEGIQAYLRLLPPGATFPTASIGRVIAVKRRQGLGGRIVAEGVRAAQELLGADAITIEAQTYARGLYEQAGFVQSSEEFLEDGIPHIQMVWKKP